MNSKQVLLYLFFLPALLSCSGEVEIQGAPAPPSVPTGLFLQSPQNSPAFNSTPTIRVEGVQSGFIVELFNDPYCQNKVGEAVASGNHASVTIDPLDSGIHTFYAHAGSSHVKSDCSKVSVDYEFLGGTSVGVPNGLSIETPNISPSFLETPVIRVSGVIDDHIIRLTTDQDCTNKIGEAIASNGEALITSDPLLSGEYTFFANARDPDGNYSQCSQASTDYEVASPPSLVSPFEPSLPTAFSDSPSFTVEGLHEGHQLQIFDDPSCTTPQLYRCREEEKGHDEV